MLGTAYPDGVDSMSHCGHIMAFVAINTLPNMRDQD